MTQHMKTPPVVSQEAWEGAYEEMLVKEKAVTRARDALAAEGVAAGLGGRTPGDARQGEGVHPCP